MTILAIGAHIGDAELMSGSFLVEAILQGKSATILALTPGELGNPNRSPQEYRIQKLDEHRKFCERIGAQSIVFENGRDGFLEANDEIALRIARIIRELRPELVLAHWEGSFHPDHQSAHALVRRAVFLSSLSLPEEQCARILTTIKYCENWEDMRGFESNEHHAISDNAFNIWREAIEVHEFAHGDTSGFRYIDYYTALMTAKGCLNNSQRAVSLMRDPFAVII